MNAVDVRWTLGITGALLVLAGLLLVGTTEDMTTSFVWPFVLLFLAVGLGLVVGVLMSLGRVAGEARRQASH